MHFFKDDDKLERFYNKPLSSACLLSRFYAAGTPDFSIYKNMPLAVQIFNTFKNRWCGAYWQSLGIRIIPTISWGDENSYDFCFSGVEKGAYVLISNIGINTESEKSSFIKGYEEMIKRIEPLLVICYGHQFPQMKENTRLVEYKFKQ